MHRSDPVVCKTARFATLSDCARRGIGPLFVGGLAPRSVTFAEKRSSAGFASKVRIPGSRELRKLEHGLAAVPRFAIPNSVRSKGEC